MKVQSLTRSAGAVALCVCLIVVTGVSGCGSKTEKSDIVTPPSINEDPSSNETSSTDPPGKLELPPGEIPAEKTSPDAETNGGGLQLPDTPTDPPKSTTSESSAAAKVQYASWEEIEKAATTSGRVTVVDIWSTVCGPCLEEFPNLVKLHKEHGKSIQCISMDVDYDGRKSRPPETYEADVVKFLTKVGADFPNYISKTPSDDVLDTLKVISIPTVLVFDAEGKLVKKFVDAGEGFSYEKDVVPFVTKLAG